MEFDMLRAIENEIITLETRLDELRISRTEFLAAADREIKAIAELLHKHECKQYHEDQCGWYYENEWDRTRPQGKDTWNGWAHRRYLDVAQQRVKESGVTVPEFLAALRVVYRDREEMGGS